MRSHVPSKRRFTAREPGAFARALPRAVAAFLVISAAGAAAQGDADRIERGVKAEGQSAIVGMSAEQAQLLALQRARASAIEQASGVAVSSSTLVKDSALAADFIKTYARGFIVKETVEWLPGSWYRESASKPPIPEYGVRITVDVKIPAKKAAPMNLSARLNANVFREGEKAALKVRTSREARVAVFNITADDRVAMVYPHPTDRSPLLPPGGTVTLPPPESQYEWVLQTLPGHKEDAEAFYVIALDRSHDRDFCKLFDCGVPMPLAEFFEKYAEFASWCEEYILAYRVVAKE